MPSENEKEIVYWDSCVFIDFLQQTSGRYEACKYIHDRAESGTLIIVTSTVTLAEVARLPDAGGLMPHEKSRQILDYFKNPYIAVRQLDRTIAERAHEICRSNNLIHLDAIHLATALNFRVSILYTYDSKKQRRKGLLRHNLKLGSPPLPIEMPPAPPPPPPPLPRQGTLFELPTIDENKANENSPNPDAQHEAAPLKEPVSQEEV
jgi:predicted nucleic acid-binding protein